MRLRRREEEEKGGSLMSTDSRKPVAHVQKEDCPVVENPPGIFRTTLAWNEQTMLCHFRMKKGARIPLHDHPAAQNGYMVSGKVRFLNRDGEVVLAVAGTGYCFGSARDSRRRGPRGLGGHRVFLACPARVRAGLDAPAARPEPYGPAGAEASDPTTVVHGLTRQERTRPFVT